MYVDDAVCNSVDEIIFLRLDPDEKFKPDEKDSLVANSILTTPKAIIEFCTKAYENLHAIYKNRRDLSSIFNDQGSEFDNNKLTILDSITVNRDPTSDNEPANKKYVDDSIGQGNVLRFNRTLQNYLEVSVENDAYNLTKNER